MARTDAPIVVLRQLFREMAVLMQGTGTFKDIADRFYEVGLIDAPESPYPDYEGTKRDYVMEKLHCAMQSGKDLDAFLRTTVPHVVYDADMEGIHTGRAEFLMRTLGYYKDPTSEAVQHGLADYTAPETFRLPTVSQPSGRATSRRIEIPDLPAAIQELVDELEDCVARRNRNAGALLTRKIIHRSVGIAMQRRGRVQSLRTTEGEPVDLSVALSKCAQEYGIPNQVISRVRSAKWIGDSANHSYSVKVTDGDLDTAVTALRLFLPEVL
jgi:hypothetical protein